MIEDIIIEEDIIMISGKMINLPHYWIVFLIVSIFSFLVCPLSVMAQKIKPDFNSFLGGKIKGIYILRLDPGDLLLEGIQELVKKENIADGTVISGIGTLSECRMHWVTTTGFPPVEKYETLKEPLELMSIQGIIADGTPHLHITVSDTIKAIGGHLENGCKVLYLAEIVIASFDGAPLIRRPNEQGIKMLQKK